MRNAANSAIAAAIDEPAPTRELGRAATGATPGCPELEIDGVRLAFDDVGSGDAVVCLHAVGHGAGDFRPFAERHRDRMRVIAVDWPGHGRSADDHAPPRAARFAALLPPLLDALGLARVVVVGNSIGGAAALRFAAAHPERVRGVVAANPGGLVAYGFQKRVMTRLVARFFAAGAGGARWYPRAFAALYGRLLSEPSAAVQRARIVASGRAMAPLLAQAWQGFGEPDDDLLEILPGIACPVLVTWSLNDPLNPVSYNRAGIARLPNARVQTFAGGHAPFLECPEAFDAVFARFLETLR